MGSGIAMLLITTKKDWRNLFCRTILTNLKHYRAQRAKTNRFWQFCAIFRRGTKQPTVSSFFSFYLYTHRAPANFNESLTWIPNKLIHWLNSSNISSTSKVMKLYSSQYLLRWLIILSVVNSKYYDLPSSNSLDIQQVTTLQWWDFQTTVWIEKIATEFLWYRETES